MSPERKKLQSPKAVSTAAGNREAHSLALLLENQGIEAYAVDDDFDEEDADNG